MSKKVQCLGSGKGKIREKEKAKIIFELRRDFEFKISCLIKIGEIKRSTYYYHIKNFEKEYKYKDLEIKILEIWNKNKGRYGYRRIHLSLKNCGIKINHKTVQKLIKRLGLKCLVRLKKYKSYRGEIGKIAPNIISQNFKAVKPMEKLVTDITEFSLLGEKIYLSPILDLFNGEIISFTTSSRPTFRMIEDMLNKIKKKNKSKLILHSDQGMHYQQKRYQRLLKEKNIVQSMSRKGNCLDNAVIENFFGHVKSELFYLEKFVSMEDFNKKLHDYIHYYNHERIKINLKGLTPVQYRIQSSKHCRL
ncbi:MAG: IS3 family transposase [Fusobacteriaceae bacterium]